MAAVFNTIKITWNDEEHQITPTMALLNKIEQDVSLSEVAYRMASQKPPLSHLATIMAHFLRSAGVDVTDEDVYAEICVGDQKAVEQAAEAVMYAAFPNAGKPVAPAKQKKQAAAKSSRKK